MVTWAPWYGDIFRVNRLAASPRYRLVLGFTPPVCLLFLFASLHTSAAEAVRNSSLYILIYMAVGAAWLGVSCHLFAFLGVSARDDALERRNHAALIATIGAMIGIISCFAGANIGEGPGVEVVVVSAATATGSWFVLWHLLEALSGHTVSERITVERNAGSGVRLAGLLVANGAILGAAVAGDWVPERFLYDFAASAWPACLLTVLAILVERRLGLRSSVGRSILIASGYLLLALVWIFPRSMGA